MLWMTEAVPSAHHGRMYMSAQDVFVIAGAGYKWQSMRFETASAGADVLPSSQDKAGLCSASELLQVKGTNNSYGSSCLTEALHCSHVSGEL